MKILHSVRWRIFILYAAILVVIFAGVSFLIYFETQSLFIANNT